MSKIYLMQVLFSTKCFENTSKNRLAGIKQNNFLKTILITFLINLKNKDLSLKSKQIK